MVTFRRLSPIRTLIGCVAWRHVGPPMAMRSFLVATWSHGVPRSNLQSLARVQNPSIELLPTQHRRWFGCCIFFAIFSFRCRARLCFYVTITVLSFLLRTLLLTNGPSILILTIILYGNWWLLENFVLVMSPLRYRLRTFSPKG